MDSQDHERGSTFPVLPVQAGMLFHGLVSAGGYVQQCVVTMADEELAQGAFVEAWQVLAARHEAVRAAFRLEADGSLAQVVGAARVPVCFLDWREADPSGLDGRLQAFLREDLRRGVDPSAPPLHRVAVLLEGARRQRFVWTSHHAVLDGRSRVLLLAELFERYAALSQGRAVELPRAPSWADYVRWRAAWSCPEAEAFWRAQLADAPPRATAAPACAGGSSGSEEEPFGEVAALLARGAWLRLQALCGELDVTPATAVVGAWALLSARRASSEDVVVGVARSCRHAGFPGEAALVGNLVATVPLRVRVGGRERVGDWLRALRATSLALRPYELTPLADAARWGGARGGDALFDSLVSVERRELGEALAASAGAVAGRTFEVRGAAHYPLVLSATTGDELRLRLCYERRRFDEAAARRLLAEAVTVLERMVEDPGRALGDLDVLPAAERRLLLDEWGKSSDEQEDYRSVVDRTLCSGGSPDAVALVGQGERVTYAELRGRVAGLARELCRRGVEAQEPVGLWAERGAPSTVVGLLGILAAGGACVPLDPDHPAARREHVVRVTGLRFLVGDPAPADLGGSSIERVRPADVPPGTFEPRPLAPAALAMVLFTSGSTGAPKGVELHHGGLANVVAWQSRHAVLGGALCTLQRASFAWDLSLIETLPTLAAGGSLVLCTAAAAHDPDALWRLVLDEGVERLFVPPVLLQYLAEAAPDPWPGGRAPRLRVVLAVGEQPRVTAEVRRLFGRLDRGTLANAYGPTETHPYVTADVLSGAPDAWPTLPSIGRPIAGVRTVLLDRDLRLVPVGCPGELCIGGVAPGRGYRGSAAQTAERFVPDPFAAGAPGARLYRSGDLCCHLDDGRLQFLGRVDRQLKVHGHRVEPGEVEAALERHPDVRRAAVLGRPDPAGGLRLVAFVEPRGPGGPSSRELRRHVAQHLPSALVPAAVVVLPQLPLSANGKVDLARLPEAEAGGLAEEGLAVEAPGGAVERALADVFARVLGVARVGLHQDFFEAGGDSLGLMQVAALAREALGRAVPVPMVAGHPSPAALASALAAEPDGAGPPGGTPPAVESWAPPGLTLSSIALRGRVDAATLSYLPEWLPGRARLGRPELLRDWYGGAPFVSRILDGPHGRVAVLTLPVFGDELFASRALLRRLVEAGLAMAKELGAAAASMAGLLPAALDYGRGLEGSGLTLTTGHGTTVAAVVLNLLRALEAAGRELRGEDVAFVGLGSIGAGALRLMVDALPPPRSLVLCDVPAKEAEVGALARDVAGRGFPGEVRVALFHGELPPAVYEATTVVGATSVPDVLRVERLAPGTVVVDDSGPHCFDAGEALRRSELYGDLLCLEGGLLEVPGRLHQESFVPPGALAALDGPSLLELTRFDEVAITGCVLSALLTARHGGPPTVGLPDRAESAGWLTLLGRLGYRAPAPRLGARAHAAPDLARFRAGFGRGRPGHRPAPAVGCLHELVRARALQAPGAVALRFEGTSSTYGELWSSAQGVARRLRARGVVRGERVGVALPHGPGLVSAVLGVLAAGGACVPLDVAFPDARLRELIVAADVRSVLSAAGDAGRFGGSVARVLTLDPNGLVEGAAAAESVVGCADDVAFVFSTSGSTGGPKGVVQTHRQVCGGQGSGVRFFQLGPDDRVLLRAPLSVSGFAAELLWALAGGGRAVLARLDQASDPGCLVRLIREEAVTALLVVPSLLRALVGEPDFSACSSLRVVCSAGEPLDQALRARVDAALPGRLAVIYGTTEAPSSTARWLPPDVSVRNVGWPLGAKRLYVLDDGGRPVPFGEPGELHVGGEGVAAGYLGRPEATAARFVPDPFAREAGARMYRTGDVARLTGDGSLECLGRLDDQLKVRGHRVEPGEIEEALLAQEGVREAAVVARRDSPEAVRLVAWFVASGPTGPSPEALRAALAAALPPHMVPAAVVATDALPRTASGKVDRRALVARGEPVASPPGPDAPRTPLEEALLRIFAERLGRPAVGFHESFLALGGDSLTAIGIRSSIRDRLGVDVPLHVLFDRPSVAQLTPAVVGAALRGSP